ncbi:MAG: nucleotidyltransferase family protein [Candidatus Micrarchaeia archaeon]
MDVENAIILAGGKGTRLRPLTFDVPKPLIKINGKPLIEYVIEELERNGIKNIYLSLGYKSSKIVDYFKKRHKFGANIEFVVEGKPLGTGGAIKYAMSKLQNYSKVVVVNADTIYRIDLARMLDVHNEKNALVTMGVVNVDDISGFGVIEAENGKVTNFAEKPNPENTKSKTINAGIYIINRNVFEKYPLNESFSFEKEFLEKVCKSENIMAFPVEKFTTINDIKQYKEAKEAFENAGGEI